MLGIEYYEDFNYNNLDAYASSLKHHIKSETPEIFMSKYDEEPNISDKAKKLYLVSIIEFICNKHNIKKPLWINKYKSEKMDKVLFSQGAMLFYKLTGNEEKLITDYNNSIIEFKEHNIIETTLDDILWGADRNSSKLERVYFFA